MTIVLAIFALSYFAGGLGLGIEPGLAEWWWTRPIWLLVLASLLIPVALVLSPLERVSRAKDAPVPAAWRLVSGAIMAGLGITLATLFGFDGDLLSLTSTGTIALVLGGAAICGLSVKLS